MEDLNQMRINQHKRRIVIVLGILLTSVVIVSVTIESGNQVVKQKFSDKTIGTIKCHRLSQSISQNFQLVLPNSFIQYIVHEPIYINDNWEFQKWNGSGIELDPYVISGFNITSTSECIVIENTNVYFQITNCFLKGGGAVFPGGTGIVLNNVKNGIIKNNFITNHEVAVGLEGASNNVVTNNSLVKNFKGVGGSYCTDNLISENTIHNSEEIGINLGNSNTNIIVNNTISYNLAHGVLYEGDSNGNVIAWNNFIENNPFEPKQADDHKGNKSDNLFQYNYWNDWTSPDTNEDGIVDIAYTFWNYNQDQSPLTTPVPFAPGIPARPADFVSRKSTKQSDTSDYVRLGIFCGLCTVVFGWSMIALLQKNSQVHLKFELNEES
ncbi:MAG: nitrous oxide reductase family maturation protein NosD [Candidatus Hodarchaeota archaeon]